MDAYLVLFEPIALAKIFPFLIQCASLCIRDGVAWDVKDMMYDEAPWSVVVALDLAPWWVVYFDFGANMKPIGGDD